MSLCHMTVKCISSKQTRKKIYLGYLTCDISKSLIFSLKLAMFIFYLALSQFCIPFSLATFNLTGVKPCVVLTLSQAVLGHGVSLHDVPLAPC